MRILILSFYYVPDLSAGSFRTDAFIHELGNIIDDSDHVDIISTKPNRYDSFSMNAKNNERLTCNIIVDRVDVGEHGGGGLKQSKLFLRFSWEVLKIIKKREKYDLVYATSSRLMTAFLGSIIANKQNAKLYLDIRDIFTDTLQSVFATSLLRFTLPFFRLIEKYTARSATHINLVSQGFEKHFKKINNDIGYSFYTNGIDKVFIDYDFSKTQSTNKKKITYAGNIGEGQGLEKIVPEMAEYLRDGFEINIYGDGGRKKALIDSLKGIENVIIHDPVSRNELLEIYKNSDMLFLHLNNYDSFEKVLPSKLFEYAATNKFIIAGVSGVAKEFIRTNITGAVVFEPCNFSDFCDKFSRANVNEGIDRTLFTSDFAREKIMKLLSKEVYDL